MPRAAILGPGGVGGFLAAALSRAGGDPVVVAREETAELIDRDGLKVESVRLGEFAARPRAAATLEEPVEVLFVATKSTGLDAGLERIRAEPELVVPLLNGLDHMAVLRERVGPRRVAAATIRVESDPPRPGRVGHTNPLPRVHPASP